MNPMNSRRFRRKNILMVFLALSDLAIIWLSLCLALWLRFSSGLFGTSSALSGQNALLLLAVSVGWLLIFAAYGLYQERNFFPVLDQLHRVLKAVVVGTVVLLILVFVLKADQQLHSRLFFGFGFLINLAFLFLWRGLLFSKFICRPLEGWGVGKRVLIVGAGERGRHLAKYIAERPSLGLDVVGFVDDRTTLKGGQMSDLTVLGTTEDISDVVREYDVGEIFLGIPSLSHAELLTLIDKCKATQLPVTLTSELLNVVSQCSPLGKIDGVPAITIQPNKFSEVSRAIKRVSDLILAYTGLLLTAPLLALAGILIKVSSPGPVFFKQVRIGKNGCPFTIYKLRTMRDGQDDSLHRQYLQDFISTNKTAGENEEGEKQFKLDNDPRVTKVGKMLRRLSLDEIPQLINVIRGEMSLVGPRPPLPYEVEMYKNWHGKRLQVKPGITGLWQVTARSAVGFDDMVMLDLYYIEHWSLLLDFQLLLKTIPAAVTGKGAL